MGWFDSFFHPENAYKEAGNVANQGYRQSQGYLNPLIQQGQEQYGKLMGAENRLLDPVGLTNEWSNAYQTSPYAQQELRQNMEQGQEAASQMGINGSSAALSNIQTGAGNIVNKDREGFLDRLMKKYLEGIGLGKSIYGTGAEASGLSANNALTHGNDLAGLKYKEKAAPGQMMASTLGALGNIGAGFAGTPGIQNWLGAANKFNPWGDTENAY